MRLIREKMNLLIGLATALLVPLFLFVGDFMGLKLWSAQRCGGIIAPFWFLLSHGYIATRVTLKTLAVGPLQVCPGSFSH